MVTACVSSAVTASSTALVSEPTELVKDSGSSVPWGSVTSVNAEPVAEFSLAFAFAPHPLKASADPSVAISSSGFIDVVSGQEVNVRA
jgi:hypothetical protein